MSTFGELKEFVPETEKISVYLERAYLNFTANGVRDDQKVPIFRSTVGMQMYHLIWNLFTPNRPQDQMLAEIYKRLTRDSIGDSSGDGSSRCWSKVVAENNPKHRAHVGGMTSTASHKERARRQR